MKPRFYFYSGHAAQNRSNDLHLLYGAVKQLGQTHSFVVGQLSSSSNGDLQGCTIAIILNVKAAIKTNTIIPFTKLFIIN
jgi:hypothetical protein